MHVLVWPLALLALGQSWPFFGTAQSRALIQTQVARPSASRLIIGATIFGTAESRALPVRARGSRVKIPTLPQRAREGWGNRGGASLTAALQSKIRASRARCFQTITPKPGVLGDPGLPPQNAKGGHSGGPGLLRRRRNRLPQLSDLREAVRLSSRARRRNPV